MATYLVTTTKGSVRLLASRPCLSQNQFATAPCERPQHRGFPDFAFPGTPRKGTSPKTRIPLCKSRKKVGEVAISRPAPGAPGLRTRQRPGPGASAFAPPPKIHPRCAPPAANQRRPGKDLCPSREGKSVIFSHSHVTRKNHPPLHPIPVAFQESKQAGLDEKGSRAANGKPKS